MPEPESGDLGMEYYTIVVPNTTELDQVEKRLTQHQADSLNRIAADELTVKDPNGISVHIQTK